MILRIVIILFLIVTGAIALYLSIQVSNLNFHLDALKEKIVPGDSTIEGKLGELFGMNIKTVNNYIGQGMEQIISTLSSKTGNVFISMDNPLHTVFKVVIMFIIVQFLENNIITPNVVGSNVKINALTIIIGLLIGNLIWGIAGMLIIIPYIAILKIIMHNIDSLQPFASLISDEGLEKHQLHVLRFFKKYKEKIQKL